MRPKTALVVLVLLLLAILPAVTPARAAQTQFIRLTLEAGYDGYFRDGQWMPVLVTVSNTGPDISGELRITSSNTAGLSANAYVVKVELPTQSSKQVFLYITLQDYAQQVQVELVNENGILASDVRDVRPSRPADLLFAVITESPRGVIDLKSLRTGIGTAHQANWRLENLPGSGLALRGLDALVFTDANTSNLTPEQQRAIEDWVIGGGHLVVTGGPNWQKTQAGVTKLLPFKPGSTTTLSSLPSLAEYAGRPDDKLTTPNNTPIVVATGQVASDSQVLAQESGVPLLVRHALGQGYVDYLAVDPGIEPLQSWPDRAKLWFTLFTTSGQRPSWSNGIVETQQAAQAADFIKGVRLPEVAQLCGFLAIYIVLIGPLNYLILKQLGRRELAWVTIPVIIVLTSVFSYVTGFSLRGTQATVNRLALVQVWPGSERAQVDGVIGLLAPRRSVYDLIVGNGMALRALTSRFGLNTMSSGGVIYENPTLADINYEARDIPVDAGTTVSLATSGYTQATPIEGSAVIRLTQGNSGTTSSQPQVTRVTGTMRNTTGLTLTNTVVLVMGGFQEIGLLRPGESRDFVVPVRADRSPPVAPVAGAFGRSDSTSNTTVRHIMGSSFIPEGRNFRGNLETQEMWRRQLFLQAVAIDLDPSGGRGADVYVAGWTDNSPISVDLNGAPFITEDTTLYIYRLPVTVSAESSNGIVEVPSAYLTWSGTDRSTLRDVYTPYELRLQPGDRAVFRYNTMPLMRLSEVSEIRLTIRTSSISRVEQATVSFWDWTAGEWVDINARTFLTRISNVQRFIGPENSIEVKVEPAPGQNFVYFERMDLTLYGRPANSKP